MKTNKKVDDVRPWETLSEARREFLFEETLVKFQTQDGFICLMGKGNLFYLVPKKF